jgi:hypothetical protein
MTRVIAQDELWIRSGKIRFSGGSGPRGVAPSDGADLIYDPTRGALVLSVDGRPYRPVGTALVSDVQADFGAKGDGRTVTDGAMTSGSAVVTSATAAFTAADVGKFISVRGANTAVGGETLVGTIATYISATQVTASIAANATVSSKRVVWGTIDTLAIQAALDAVAAARRGVVYLPVGIYLIDAQLLLSGVSDDDPIRGATVCGEKGATLWAADVNIPYTGGVTGSLLASIYAEDVTFRDLIFQGTGTGFTGPRLCALRMTGKGLNTVYHNLTFNDFKGAIPLDYSGTQRAVIDTCYVDACDYGIVQSNLDGSASIVNCQVTNPSQADTLVPGICVSGRDNRISKNYIETPAETFSIWIGDTSQDACVIGNTIKGPGTTTSSGIRIHADTGGDCVIMGNQIDGCGTAIVLNGTSITVTGNQIRGGGVGYTGIATFYDGNPASEVSITGNAFANCAKGIDGGTLASGYVTVTGNIFPASVTDPIAGEGSWTNSKGVGNAGLADF